MKIGIIGSGIVGQATGIGLIAKGHQVKFYDIDENKLLTLKNNGYDTNNILDDVIDFADTVFVSVPTPTVGQKIDLKIIIDCSKSIAKAIKRFGKYIVVTYRSTIPPQTSRTILLPVLEKFSGLNAGIDFGVCMNPEFLREKSPIQDFLNPNRIVIGALDKRSAATLQKIYSYFKCPVIVTDLDTAEMIKYTSNTFLAAKISFFNEMYLMCRKLGLNEQIVSNAVALDPRIGSYGVAGGSPFAGMCLPKDLQAFIHFAGTKGFNPVLLKAISKVNKEMSQYCTLSSERAVLLELPTTCSS